MPQPSRPRRERAESSSHANREVALTLVGVAMIVAILWLFVYALAALFDPYLNSRPVYRPPLHAPAVWGGATKLAAIR
jgi:hypothetical protein